MPLFEMPLSELKTYEGRNPKPDDFDTFWNQSIREMHGVDSQVERAAATFQVPNYHSYDVFFTGVQNARIHAKYVQPSSIDTPVPAILIFHGYTGKSPSWLYLLGFAAAGFAVAALDCRGQAGLSQDTTSTHGTTIRGHIIRGLSDPPEKMLFRQIFLDTAQLARIVMGFDEVDANRVGAIGGSQGGGLALACASLEENVKRITPKMPFLSDYQRVWEMDLAKNAYEELTSYFRAYDPQHKQEDAIFTKLGYIDVQHLAPRIKAETLMAVGLMDMICPPSTQFAAYNKIAAPKQLRIYPDYTHEDFPGFDDEALQFFVEME